MSIASARRGAFLISRALGDVQAVKRGRVGARVTNRVVGGIVSRSLRGVWR